MTLREKARQIYRTSMELAQGMPRTRYRRMKVEELPKDEQAIVRGHMENMRTPPPTNQFWGKT